MNAKVAVLAVVLAILTVLTFPLSVGGWLIYGVWRFVRGRRQAVAVYQSHPARVARYEAALVTLDRQIAATIRETELLAQIKYKEWLLDKERRKQYWVTHGVTLPETVRQRELDTFFSAMQQRLEARQVEFERDAARIAAEERRQLTYARDRAEASERAQAAEEAQAAARQLEQERRAAEQVAVEKIARALAGDLA